VKKLTVLYDAACEVCVRSRYWLGAQPAFVALEFLPCDSDAARARYGAVPWLGEELVVVSDDGDVWAGTAAFLVCLWALVEWRDASYSLTALPLVPFVDRFFHTLSSRRKWIATLLPHAGCPSGACRAPHATRHVYR
jgi:predicted DCC family thiol-disulfide oxidoreductase YuxK